MTWLPKFLNIWPAALAAAIVIPSLLILYFLKLRRREMPVSSTFLWKKAIQDLQVNSPFQRLRRNLLLLLQLLLLILLLLSLSRPVTNFRPPAGDVSVILIDRSASMNALDIEGKPRLEEAKRRAKELVDSMPRKATAMVIAFDDSAETLQTFTSDAAALRMAIDRIQPTDRPSRAKLAYQLADAQMNFNPDQLRPATKPPDVYLFSDGRVLDAAEVTIRGNLKFEKVGTSVAGNVAIVALSAKRNYERPTEVQVFARLANYGPEPVEVPVQLKLDGEVVDVGGHRQQMAYCLPEHWDKEARDKFEHDNSRPAQDSVTFNLDVTTSAVLTIEQLAKSGDVLAADDVAQVIVPPPRSLAVLLVTEGNYYLELAIQNLDLKNPDVMRPIAYEDLPPEKRAKYDVFIFDRYSPKKMPPAGNFIYFLDANKPELPPDVKVRIAKDPQGKPISLGDMGVLDWRRDHPILKDVGLSRLYVGSAVKLDVPQESEVIIDGLKGPLLVMSRASKMTHLIAPFDVLDSNWPLQIGFPIFLHNALQYLAVGSDMDVRQSYQPGATPGIPRANLQKLGDVTKITLTNPDGSRRAVAIPESGDFALPPLDHVGVYITDPPIPQFEKLAVNLLDANESDLVPADRAPGDINAPIEEVKDTKARLELWWWIVACGALPLLLVEWWVYTRRVHL
ncbi:MAG TPA: BatA and WFA domain-containing protein [Humisphaera sp.]|jgi:hypothetical protein|nr:BatA and WFA domain-containing protein [Humisphaera sp.]